MMNVFKLLFILLIGLLNVSYILTNEDEVNLLNSCKTPSKPIDFKCTKEGRFSDPNDIHCKSYITCSKLKPGSYLKTEYKCPDKSLFDAAVGSCSAHYTCKCDKKTTTHRPITKPTTHKLTTHKPTTHKATTHKHTTHKPTTHKTTTNKPTTHKPTTHKSTVELTTTTEAITSTTLSSSTNKHSTSKILPSTSTTAKDNCIIPINPVNFHCKERGRFLDLNNPYCTTYYLCSYLRNSTFIKTMYKCPRGSYFDSSISICTIENKCPCKKENTSTTVQESTTTSTTINSTVKPSSISYDTTSTTTNQALTTKEPTATTKSSTGTQEIAASTVEPMSTREDIGSTTLSSTTNEPFTSTILQSTSTAKDDCTIPIKPIDFQCKERGRFIDPNNPYCRTYYLCSHLQNSTLIKTMYKCPRGSYFDSSISVCSIKNKCPCKKENGSTTTQKPITTSSNVTSEIVTFTAKTTSRDITSTTLSSTTDEPLTSTILPTTSFSPKNDCIVPINPNDFECKKKGRFIDSNNPFCTTYFLCSLLRNGTFLKTPYSCPKKSYFDSSIGICNIKYQCPCKEGKSTSVQPTPTTTKYSTASSIIASTEGVPSTTQYVISSTPQDKPTTKKECIIPIIPIDFKCKKKGRFVDRNNPFCTTYFLCSLLRNGTFLKTPYSCPKKSYFDSSIGICNIKYQCPCKEGISTTTQPISTTEYSTASSIVTTIEDVSSTEDILSTTQAISSSTPRDISTTSEPTSTIESTTKDDCIIPINPGDFECKERGRFADPNNPFCTTYFLCSLLHNGTLLKTPYTCPKKSYFDSSIGICNIKYQCPCKEGISTAIQPISTTEYSTASGNITTKEDVSSTVDIVTTTQKISSSTPKDISTTSEPISTIESTTKDDCITPINPMDFKCKKRGRYADPNNPFCNTYFLCSLLRNGTILKTPYTCPKKSYFDSSIGICNINYQCPCKERISTTTQPISTTKYSTDSSIVTTKEYVSSSTQDILSTTQEISSSTPNDMSATSEPTSTIEPTSSTTKDDCIIPINPMDFECEKRGRFADPNNPFCTTYFLCSLLRNGTILKTPYACPKKSYFDSSIGICNIKYQCPCKEGISTTTQSIFTTEYSTVITTENISSTTKEIDLSTLQDISTTSEPTSTAKDNCAIPSNSMNFKCKERGRFLDPNNPFCTTYYLCSHLRNSTFIKTKYNCPVGSYFDSSISICNIENKCPCKGENTTTTQETPSTTTITTTIKPTTTPSTGKPKTTTTDLSTVQLTSTTTRKPVTTTTTSTVKSTTSLKPTTTNKSSSVKPTSTTDTSTVKPTTTTSSRKPMTTTTTTTLKPTTTNKPSTAKPITTTTTRKPTITTTNRKPTTTTIKPTITTSTGKPTTTTTNRKTTTTTIKHTTSTLKPTTTTTTRTPITTTTKPKTTSRKPTTTTIKPTITTSTGKPTTTTTNRKPTTTTIKPTTSTLKPTTTTTTRKPITTTTKAKTTSRKPTTTTMKPKTTPKTTTSTIKPTTTTINPECKDNTGFKCSTAGRFKSDKKCKRYYICSELKSGKFLKTQYTCPRGSKFNPILGNCSINYECPC